LKVEASSTPRSLRRADVESMIATDRALSVNIVKAR